MSEKLYVLVRADLSPAFLEQGVHFQDEPHDFRLA